MSRTCRDAEVKNGRPPREGFAKVKTAVGIVANYDLPNFAMESVLPDVGEKRKNKGGKK